MTQRILSVLALVSLTLAACGSSGPSPTMTPPTVVSIEPANGAKGVKADARIVVTFSKPMNQAATETAYQSADLPASGVTFGWNADGTVMTVTPNTPLTYATGTQFTVTAPGYAFSITGAAMDTSGQRLALTNSAFTTRRVISVTLPTIPSLDAQFDMGSGGGSSYSGKSVIHVGDTYSNDSSRGFLTFDLSGVPADAVAGLVDATLNVTKYFVENSPYTALNPCIPTKEATCASRMVPMTLEHIVFGDTLLAGAYSTPALHTLGAIDNQSISGQTTLKSPVLIAVQNDLTNRAARGNRSQYRLSFPRPTNGDSVGDFVALYSGSYQIAPPFIAAEFQLP